MDAANPKLVPSFTAGSLFLHMGGNFLRFSLWPAPGGDAKVGPPVHFLGTDFHFPGGFD